MGNGKTWKRKLLRKRVVSTHPPIPSSYIEGPPLAPPALRVPIISSPLTPGYTLAAAPLLPSGGPTGGRRAGYYHRMTGINHPLVSNDWGRERRSLKMGKLTILSILTWLLPLKGGVRVCAYRTIRVCVCVCA